MVFYNMWCSNEGRYTLQQVINQGKNQIIHCMSCNLHKTNTRLSKYASISDYLLKQENLNHNWGNRKQQQLLKQKMIEQRRDKAKNFMEQGKEKAKIFTGETKRGAIWLKKKIQRK